MNGKHLNELGLPSAERTDVNIHSNEFLRETSYYVQQLNQYLHENEPLLVKDQRRRRRNYLRHDGQTRRWYSFHRRTRWHWRDFSI